MRIKLRDIAERANVSLATVSRVINNNLNVDEQTRASVMTVLAQLGYPMTKIQETGTLKGEKTIIVVTRSVEGRLRLDNTSDDFGSENILPNDFDPLVIDGIETVLRRYGLRTRIERIGLEKPTPTDLIQLQQADGIVIVGGIVGRTLVTYLESSNIPFVLAGAHLGDKEINCVLGDYLRSAAQAIATLTELGHRRITARPRLPPARISWRGTSWACARTGWAGTKD